MQGTSHGTTSELEPTRAAGPHDESIEEAGAPPVELDGWLRARVDHLVDHWIHELRVRELGEGEAGDGIVARFARFFVRMLPVMIGPYRDQVRPLWDRAAELYGGLAAKRGLAAGEAIEELHVLRELVIRELYRNPPGSCAVPLMLREFLRLNRSLDRAVTHASVGHTDALFFQFFEGDGVRAPLLSGDDVDAEAERQLDEIHAEADEILRQAPWNDGSGARGN